MTGRRHVGLVAALATLLAAMPLSTIFAQWTWFVQCIIAIALIEGAATLARTLRAPVWAQLAAMIGALLASLTLLFGDASAILGLIPTGGTFVHFGALLSQAGTGIREMGVPVSDHQGLLFLTVLGVGSVAIWVDVCAVALRRPALAGLPMLAIYSVPVAVHQDSVSVLPFVAGAAGFLWLLVIDNVDRVRRFGRRFTGDGRDIDVWEPSPLAAAGRRLAIVGVLVAVALPVMIPGMTTGLLDRFGSGGNGSGTGSGPGVGRVNLWALLAGTLNQDQEGDMLRVTTKDPKPYYLRFGVADEMAGDGFRNHSPGGRTAATNLPDPRRPDRAGLQYYQGFAKVDVINLNMPLLPVYSDPIKLRKLDSTWFYDQRLNVIFSNRSTTSGKSYEFDYLRADYDPALLRRAAPVPADSEVKRLNTPVPDIKEVRERVAALTAGKTTQYDKVLALFESFSVKNGFTYSTKVEPNTGGPAIVDFLTKKTGFCVQYAAALAWLVRQAGYPARVAFGFTNGSKRDGDKYTLTNRNLHAWTEVYFEGFGWVPFDATPSTFISGSVSSAWAPDINRAAELRPGVGPTPSAGVSTGPGATGTADPTDPRLRDETDPGGVASSPGPGSLRWVGNYVIVGMLLVLAVLIAPALNRVAVRRHRRIRAVRASTAARDTAVAGGARAPGEPHVVVPRDAVAAKARNHAHAAWDELIDTLIDLQLPVDLAETPRTTAERLVRDSELRDTAAGGVRLLGRAEERARYARVPLQTSELGSSLRAVRRALAERVSRRTRLLAVLLPPSVLRRWRLAVVGRTTDTVAAMGRGWAAIVSAVSPRRLLPSRR